MSDQRIREGDLVYIARLPHACEWSADAMLKRGFDPRNAVGRGHIFTVEKLIATSQCTVCSELFGQSAALTVAGKLYGLPLAWLRRIPPLGELEGKRDERDILVPFHDHALNVLRGLGALRTDPALLERLRRAVGR